MLTTGVSPLSDEGSSIGTTEQAHVVEADEEESSSLTNSNENENDDWRVVTETGGVLIVEGDEEETEETPTSENGGGLQLSIPGTDSVPTIVGSIEALQPPTAVATAADEAADDRNDDDDAGEEDDDAGEEDDDAAEPSQVVPPSDFQEGNASKTANFTTDTSTSTLVPPTTRHNNWMVFLLVPSVFLLCVTTVGFINHRNENDRLIHSSGLMENRILFLTNDIDMIKAENERLADLQEETELLRLKALEGMNALELENELLLDEMERLQRQVRELQKENERIKRDQELRWDHGQNNSNDTVTLVDNCWLTAKANVQFGDCAKDAKDAVKDFSTSLLEHLQNTTNAAAFVVRDTSVDDVMEETVTKIIHKVDTFGKEVAHNLDSLGKSLWKGTTIKTTTTANGGSTPGPPHPPPPPPPRTDYSNNKLSDFFSKMDDTGKSWFKDALLGMFAEDNDADEHYDDVDGSDTASRKHSSKSETLDELFEEISEMMKAGETVMDRAIEKAAEAMDMNHDELLNAAKQAFQEADLSQYFYNSNKKSD